MKMVACCSLLVLVFPRLCCLGLNGWGVDRVAVQGQEDPSDEETSSLLYALEHRFAGHEENPLMMRIKDAARGHLSRHR